MADVNFTDNTIEVLGAMDDRINAVLEECAGELESQAKRNTPVGKIAGGGTKNSWSHYVDGAAHVAYIGNPNETAIWLEFGTGEYALEGKGRSGGWWIPIGEGEGCISQSVVNAYGFKTRKGKNGMKFAFTRGMKPKRPLHNAYTRLKNKIINRLKNSMKGL